jgi:sodium-dependent dicarboxylate transporter 2/3/5
MNRKGQYLIISFSLLVLAVFVLSPAPAGLSTEAKNAIGIFACAIILWLTNALPLSVTGLFVIALLPLLGVMPSKDAFALFGSSAVFFILGAFILAAAMIETGLSKRIALLMLNKFDSTPRKLLAGIMLTCACLSFIMPEHAVAAMMFPVVASIANSLDLEKLNSNYGALLFLSLAWGAVIGGVGTLLGGARNPLAIGLLKESTGLEITFFEWTVAAMPIVFVMLAIAFVVLNIFFKSDIDNIKAAKEALKTEQKAVGKITTAEKKVGCVMLLTVLSWIFIGSVLGLAVIAILSAVSLFMLNVLNWRDVESNVNWGIILMYGAIFLTEGISNSACVAILIPIGLSIGDVLGINPIIMVYLIAIPAGLAFILPMGTPPNAIAYSAGYYEIRKILLPASILNLSAWLVFIIMVFTYWPLIGINLI